MTKQRQPVKDVPGRAGQGASAPGRAVPTTETADAVAHYRWRRLRTFVIATAFTLIALAVLVWSFVQQGQSFHDYRLLTWGALAVAIGLTSGAAFEFGLRRRVSVNDVQDIAWRPVVLRALGLSLVVAALICLNLAIDPSSGMARGVILTDLAIVGGIPAVTALLGIKRVIQITGELAPLEKATRLQAYLELRSMGLRLLSVLGSLVALTTFALGAAGLAAPSGTQANLTEVVITFGAIATTLVGLVYALPNQALRAEARALLRLLAPLASEDGAALRQELDEREKLERQLGLTAGLRS